MPDSFLDKFNLSFEDLNAAERDTYIQWLQSLQNKTLTVGAVRDYVMQMKEQVEAELVMFAEPKSIWDYLFRRKKDVYLTARLRNYMLLVAFLTGPEKAKSPSKNHFPISNLNINYTKFMDQAYHDKIEQLRKKHISSLTDSDREEIRALRGYFHPHELQAFGIAPEQPEASEEAPQQIAEAAPEAPKPPKKAAKAKPEA